MPGEEGHDAVLRVIDFDEVGGGKFGPSGKSFGWKWNDGRPTLSPDAHAALEEMVDEAHSRFDTSELEHSDVVARIWTNEDEAVENVEWSGDELVSWTEHLEQLEGIANRRGVVSEFLKEELEEARSKSQ